MKPLTLRQIQILQHAAEGMTINEMAIDMILARGTIIGHRFRLMQNLYARSMTQAVAIALREGIIK